MLSAAVYLFFFNDTATTEIYTLSLHDALPISARWTREQVAGFLDWTCPSSVRQALDRKSTRLNSSHITISYAVFCLKKKIDAARELAAAPRTDQAHNARRHVPPAVAAIARPRA